MRAICVDCEEPFEQPGPADMAEPGGQLEMDLLWGPHICEGCEDMRHEYIAEERRYRPEDLPWAAQ